MEFYSEFIIADTHLGHKMLVNKGMRELNFEKKLIDNWNQVVNRGNLVFHLGDFALGHYKNYSLADSILLWRNKLNGNIILIKGNHDKQPCMWYRKRGGFLICTA